ncbi:MAG TPA: nitroreductase [Lachnospiraceae bacterium]|nr:nitroreductase [Lachnospiraceae bacterium]
MDEKTALEQRHSVRQFTDKAIDADTVKDLQDEVDKVNRESGLTIQLEVNETEAFQAGQTSYGNFSGCRNYFVLTGPKGKDEEIGYYGEKLVLKAQELGLNTCWVAMTYKKSSAKGTVKPGEKRYMVIALGYGKTQGVPHKSKQMSDVSDYKEGDPDWYRDGVKAALLAPTAINQQKFRFTRNGEKVTAKAGLGFYTKTDLGIVKYNFEVGSGKGPEVWA